MSSFTILSKLEQSQKIRRHEPRNHLTARRCLYLTEQACKDFDDPQSATNLLVGKGFIEAAMTRWTAGNRIIGNERRGLFLDRLKPPPSEIWEIRVTTPDVQARLFGRFAEPNTLILTNFSTRQLLGKFGSQGWKDAMENCENNWNELFGDEYFCATTIHEYVTENVDDFPLK